MVFPTGGRWWRRRRREGGAAGLSARCALSDHQEGPILVPPDESVVVVGPEVWIALAGETAEPVHVKLPLEGLVLGLVEESGQHDPGKDRRLVNTKGPPTRVPRDYVLQLHGCGVLEHLVQFVREWQLWMRGSRRDEGEGEERPGGETKYCKVNWLISGRNG